MLIQVPVLVSRLSGFKFRNIAAGFGTDAIASALVIVVVHFPVAGKLMHVTVRPHQWRGTHYQHLYCLNVMVIYLSSEKPPARLLSYV